VEGPVVGGLEPRPLPDALARQSHVHRDVEQHGSPGHEAAGREPLDGPQLVEWQAKAVALVRERGIRVARGDDDVAALEGGPDHLVDELCPGCVEEERVGAGQDRARGPALEENRPQPFAELGSAGLTDQRDAPAAALDESCKSCGLGRLAGSLRSLDRDEKAGGGWDLGVHPGSVDDLRATIGR
jgi:hypothetical protein